MRIKLFAFIAALIIGVVPAHAQKTKAALQSEISSSFSNNNSGAITPTVVRGVFSDFVNSWQQYVGVNTQVGTTYSFVGGDYGQLVKFTNSGAMTGTLPTPAGSFLPFNVYITNSGSGTITLSATGGTINSASTLVVVPNGTYWLFADGSGTNYLALALGSGVAASVAVGTTTISGGTTTYLLYNNGGVLGNEQYVPLANGGLGGSMAAATANQVPVCPGSSGACVPTTITPSIIGSLGTGVATFLGTPTFANLSFAVTGQTIATLTAADQTLSGGANVTSGNLGTKSSGTTTIDCGTVPLQYLTNGGAFTLAAPAADGSCIVQVTNNASAGTITLSGFTVGSNTGSALDTTNTHKFMVTIARVNGSSIYNVVAQQ